MDAAGPTYADCPTVEVETDVDAPLSAVWSLVADITLPARFSAEFQGAEWLHGATGPSEGARFLGRNVHPVAGSWQTVCTIVDYEPCRKIGYVVSGLDRTDLESPAATWRFELEPVSVARIRLRYRARIGPGPSLLSHIINADPASERRVVARRLTELRRNMTATVLGIKGIAERQM
jgi:hypothetical protein